MLKNSNICHQDKNENTRKRYEISSKLSIKAPEKYIWRRSGIFVVNFDNIS